MNEGPHGIHPQVVKDGWSKSALLVTLAAVLAVGLAGLYNHAAIARAMRSPLGLQNRPGVYHVFQYDYYFVPNHMTLRVGQRVTIALRNMSETHWHEMMIGQGQDTIPTAFGPMTTEFERDFWNGLHVTVSDAHHVDNLVTGTSIPTFIGQKPPLATGGDFSPTLEPGGSIDLTFTVPNKPGVWQYGCFVQQYIHYMAGMRGTIDILPAKSGS